MANCSECKTSLTWANRDLASLKEPRCSKCATRRKKLKKKTARDLTSEVSRKQAAISLQLRSERETAEQSEEPNPSRPVSTPTGRPKQRRPVRKFTHNLQRPLVAVSHKKIAILSLWTAQIISILGCIGFLSLLPYSLYQRQQIETLNQLTGIKLGILLVGTFVGFLYFYAMAILFAYARNQCAEK
ncbi:MAG: hypothetical protein ACPGLY_08585 [Rubripirellula sp.]